MVGHPNWLQAHSSLLHQSLRLKVQSQKYETANTWDITHWVNFWYQLCLMLSCSTPPLPPIMWLCNFSLSTEFKRHHQYRSAWTFINPLLFVYIIKLFCRLLYTILHLPWLTFQVIESIFSKWVQTFRMFPLPASMMLINAVVVTDKWSPDGGFRRSTLIFYFLLKVTSTNGSPDESAVIGSLVSNVCPQYGKNVWEKTALGKGYCWKSGYLRPRARSDCIQTSLDNLRDRNL